MINNKPDPIHPQQSSPKPLQTVSPNPSFPQPNHHPRFSIFWPSSIRSRPPLRCQASSDRRPLQQQPLTFTSPPQAPPLPSPPRNRPQHPTRSPSFIHATPDTHLQQQPAPSRRVARPFGNPNTPSSLRPSIRQKSQPKSQPVHSSPSQNVTSNPPRRPPSSTLGPTKRDRGAARHAANQLRGTHPVGGSRGTW